MPLHQTLKALAALADQPVLQNPEARAHTAARWAWAQKVIDMLEDVQASEAPFAPDETETILNILTAACEEDKWPRELYWSL